MEWLKIKKKNIVSDEPCITIRRDRFCFNSVFVRLAQIEACSYMNIFCNPDERCIGFQFKKEKNSPDDYKITGTIQKGLYGACREVLEKDWVKSVIKNNKDSQFFVSRDGKIWFIRLMPAFDTRVMRTEYLQISSETTGIYRYLNTQNEIVYIGKGNIRKRLLEAQRDDWEFAAIEYSEVADDKESYEWESFWIDKYKSEKGILPIYNQIMGHKKPDST